MGFQAISCDDHFKFNIMIIIVRNIITDPAPSWSWGIDSLTSHNLSDNSKPFFREKLKILLWSPWNLVSTYEDNLKGAEDIYIPQYISAWFSWDFVFYDNNIENITWNGLL